MARGRNNANTRPIIVKKIVAGSPVVHHGGAWKVAYADFVTAMMAFFLLMWLLSSTDEQERKALAEYFTPTLVEMRENNAGADSFFGGDSIISDEDYRSRAAQTGELSLALPKDSSPANEVDAGSLKQEDREQFEKVKQRIADRLNRSEELRKLLKNIRFTETREGLRIELIDEADFSMFALATDSLLPRARQLLDEVAEAIKPAPNPLMVRGHTDALPFSSGRTMNNWMLSTARAEATRKTLQQNGIIPAAFFKIEGVADREPYTPHDIYDPRNRRISITLGWQTTPNPG
tara:strand:+ start:2084 stop:2956 length:873 start_codon:yes stop_codon:yes gene_type:complete